MWGILIKTLRGKNAGAGQLVLRFHTGIEKFPRQTRTLKQKLEEHNNNNDPAVHFKVNIGLPPPKPESRAEIRQKMAYMKRRKEDKSLEKASRTLSLEVDMDEITVEWLNTIGPQQIYTVAEHYGIYKDLFNHAFFIPYVNLEIGFAQPDNTEVPVYRGNVVKPSEAHTEPNVRFKASDNTLWTLVLTNPDGHFTNENMEYVHWFVGNIPGNNISKGELIWDYLQPFPARGIGFQRFIFILYKQDRQIDFSSIKGKLPRLELKDRTFSTLEFYRERQDYLTPAGLAFFQSDWDVSVIQTFHEKLNMEEPVFEYDHDKPYVKKQEWFPKKRPFNLYLDKYRDPRDLAKEFLLQKVENLNPFEKPKKPFPYPNVHRFKRDTPSWLIDKLDRNRIGKGRIADHREDEYE